MKDLKTNFVSSEFFWRSQFSIYNNLSPSSNPLPKTCVSVKSNREKDLTLFNKDWERTTNDNRYVSVI